MQDMDPTRATIGKGAGGTVEIDLEALLGGHACIIANSGGGKSSLIRKINEVMNGHVQEIILDAEDDFYTLREKFDFVIAGGEEGDVPATLANARDLARAALTHGFNLIVQLNDLGADAPEFVSRFLDGLMSAPRELWHPVLITIDELQRFASRDAGEATAAIKDLVFRGRKRGFTALFASLRMAEIDPGIRGMVNNWLLGRNGQALDRRTMAEQLGFTAKEGRERLGSIAQRNFWGMGPAISVEPVLFKVGDVETTPLRTGQKRVATPPPPEALRGILDGLKVETKPETIEVEAPAPDFETGRVIDKLRADLEAALADAQYWRGMAVARKGQIDRIALITFEKMIGDERDPTDDWVDIEIKSYVPMPRPVPGPPRYVHEAGEIQFHEETPAKPLEVEETESTPHDVHVPGMGTIPPRWQKILDAVAWGQMLLKMDAVDRGIIAWVNGNSPKSSGFQNDLGAMRTRGLLRYPAGGVVALTEAGANLANKPKSAPTKAQLFDMVKSSLEPRFCKILDTVYSYRRASRATIAEHLGLSEKSSGFQNDLGKLRTLGLLEYPEAGYVSLGKILA